MLSEKELENLKTQFPEIYNEKIEALSEGIASKGYKYKSHYATILSWDRKNNKDNQIIDTSDIENDPTKRML